MIDDKMYHVKFVEPGDDDHLIKPGSEHDINDGDGENGAEVRVGELASGNWLAWMPYYEAHDRAGHPELRRAIAGNKYVAAGAIQHYYFSDGDVEDEETVEVSM